MWVRDFPGNIRFGYAAFEKWFANREPLFQNLMGYNFHKNNFHKIIFLLSVANISCSFLCLAPHSAGHLVRGNSFNESDLKNRYTQSRKHNADNNFLLSSYPPQRHYYESGGEHTDGPPPPAGYRRKRRESFGSGRSSPTSSLESTRSGSSSSLASSLMTLTSVDSRSVF